MAWRSCRYLPPPRDLATRLAFHSALCRQQWERQSALWKAKRALPPAVGATAGGETGGPLWPHPPLHHVTAEHAAGVHHLHTRRRLGSKQGFDSGRGGRFPHLERKSVVVGK